MKITKQEDMKYTYFGRTGVITSKLCLGTMNFGGRTDEKESFKIMDLAAESGINFFDTANVYGHDPMNFPDKAGRSETIIGNYMSEYDLRDGIFLASKCYFEMNVENINARGSGRYHIIREIQNSLRRLQTDRIDLYQMHSPSNLIPVDETLRALDDMVKQGKILHFGSSTHAAWQLVQSFWTSERYGLNRFVSEQCAFNLLDRRAERELFPMAQTYGIGIMVWSPLAGGLLTGKYLDKKPEDSRYGSFWSDVDKMMINNANDKLLRFRDISNELGVTMDQLSIAWTMNQPGISAVIVGPRTAEQLKSNLKSLEIEFDEELNEKIDAIFTPYEMTVPYYGPNTRNGFGFIRWGPYQYQIM